MLKDNSNWKVNTSLPRSSKQAKINENGTSSSNAYTSLDIDNNEIEVHSIDQKGQKQRQRQREKGRQV